ncbi:MAG: competence protein CoiA [bacterium]
MINCLYKSKRFCSFELKNPYGHYFFDKVKLIKEAGQNRMLKCEECGKPVILKAGDKRVPHFAHLSTTNCNYSNFSKETEEHKQGKLILYQYFKEKYPDSEVQVDYRLSNGRRANIYVVFDNANKLAVEYQRKDIKIKDWRARHQNYQKLGINDLWILSTKKYKPLNAIKKDKFIFFKELLLNDSDKNIAVFLDTDTKKLTLVSKMEYRNKYGVITNQKYVWHEYKLSDITIKPDGSLDCDFYKKYDYEKKNFLEQIKKHKEMEAKRRLELNKTLHNSIKNYQTKKDKLSSGHKHQNASHRTHKSLEQLELEAEQSQKENPAGPWMDSENNRWGFCRECGIFTKDWVTFDGTNNTCKCRDCHIESRRKHNGSGK